MKQKLSQILCTLVLLVVAVSLTLTTSALTEEMPVYGADGLPPAEHAGYSDPRVGVGNWTDIPIVDNRYKVHDFAENLTPEEKGNLEQRARQISQKYDIDVVIVTTANALGRTEKDFLWDFYDANAFGTNETRDGILFLQDFDNNKINVSTHGRLRHTEDYEKPERQQTKEEFRHKDTDRILDGIIDDVLRYDRYDTYGAATYFLDEIENHYAKPQRILRQGMLIGTLISLLFAGIVSVILRVTHNKSLPGGVDGVHYTPRNITFSQKEDRFLHTFTSRTARPKQTSGGGGSGGGSSTGSSSGGSSFGGGSRSF